MININLCLVLILSLILNFSTVAFATNETETQHEQIVVSTVNSIPSIPETTSNSDSYAPSESYSVGMCELKYTALDDYGAKIDWTVSAPELIIRVDLRLAIDDGDYVYKYYKYTTVPWFSQYNSYICGWYSQSKHSATLTGTYTTASGTIYTVYNRIEFTVYADGI